MVFVAIVCVLAAQPVAKPVAVKVPVPFPHPLVTEVLYDVPSGDDSDANKDGKRSATGDEFVELVNPHEAPIQLGGYTITDGTALDGARSNANTRTQIHFTFPNLELKPGQVVVVFNGYKQSIPGPVGDALRAPEGTNPIFSDAYVFSMKVPSQYVAFANKGDCVVLRDPKGGCVQAIRWGDPSPNVPGGALLVEDAPPSLGSVQRVGLSKRLVPHTDMRPGELFSPGQFDLKAELPEPARQTTKVLRKSPVKPTTTPAPAPASTPTPTPAPATAPAKEPGKGGG